MSNHKNSPNPLSVANLTKTLAILTIFSGTFGVGYQKGMILQMGLGNLSGNYEIKEVFNSAVLGFMHLWKKMNHFSFSEYLSVFYEISLVFVPAFLILGLIILFIDTTRSSSKEGEKSHVDAFIEKVHFFFTKSKKRLYVVYGLLGSLIGLLFSIVAAGAVHVILFLCTAFVFIPLAGYLTGISEIKSNISKDPCRHANSTDMEQEYVQQCTQIVIGGKTISGEIILENADGYFLKRNQSFVFIQKDANACIYVKYYIKEEEEYKKASDISFTSVDSELEQFCGLEISKKTN